MVTKMQHAESIRVGMTIYNKRLGIVLPQISQWFDCTRREPADDLTIEPMKSDVAIAVFGHPVEILYANIHEWKHLKSMSQIIDDPRLLAVYNYFKITNLYRIVTQGSLVGR